MKPLLLILTLAASSGLAAAGAAQAAETTDAAEASRIPHLTPAQWSQDVRAFAAEAAARHRDPYHRIAKAAFDGEVERLLAGIPRMSDTQVAAGLHRLAASIGDGHTFVSTDWYRRYPLEAFRYGDAWRVTRAGASLREVVGSRIVAIGGVPVDAVDARLQAFIPQAESRWYRLDASADLATTVEPLVSLGLADADGGARFTFLRDDGARIVRLLRPAAAPAEISALRPVPLHLRHPDQPLWFEYLPDARLVYVGFRSFRDIEANGKRLSAFLAGKQVSKVVVDLRHNVGGNYADGRRFLIEPLQFMPSVNRKGRLFVVIGRRTFSAGMTIATDFWRETEATLVGEPTGARPNGFQENHFFALPNSKLSASVALLSYRFDPRDPEAVFPDVRADPDWRLDRVGRDAALDWILAQPDR